MITPLNWRTPFARATIGSLFTGIIGQLVLIVSGVLVARTLGVQNRGYLALIVLLPTVLSQLGGIGLPLAVTYYIARDNNYSWAIVRSLAKFAFWKVVILVAIHTILLTLILDGHPGAVKRAGQFTLVSVPAALALQYGLAILQGQKRFRSFNILRLVQASLYSIAILIVFLLGKASITEIVLVWVLSVLIAGCLTLFIAVRGLPKEPPRVQDISIWQLLRFGIKGFLGSVSPIENFRVDQALVGLYLSPAALGLYVVGKSFTNLPHFIAQSVGIVAYPHIASRPNPRDAYQSMWRLFWLTVAICALVVVGLEIIADWIVPFFFGDKFYDAVSITRILLMSSLFQSARRVLADSARGIGQPALDTIAEFALWISLFPALALMTPRWGLTGTASALVLSSVFSLTVLVVLVVVRQTMSRPGTKQFNH